MQVGGGGLPGRVDGEVHELDCVHVHEGELLRRRERQGSGGGGSSGLRGHDGERQHLTAVTARLGWERRSLSTRLAC